jgi:hypothetical protein
MLDPKAELEKARAGLTEEEFQKQYAELEAADKALEEAPDTTKVTTLKDELDKTGGKAPTEQEVLVKATNDYGAGLYIITKVLPKQSKRSIVRIMTALYQPPRPGQKISLQKDEIPIFGVLQRMQASLVVLSIHSAQQRRLEDIKQQQEENKDVQEKSASTDDTSKVIEKA